MSLNLASNDRAIGRAKAIALVLFFGFAPFAWLPDIYDSIQVLRRLPFHFTGAVVYLLVVGVAFAGLVVTPFLRSTLVRTPLVAAFVAAFVMDRIVLETSGAHIDASLIQVLWQSRALAGAAAREFLPTIAPLLVTCLALGIILAWPYRVGLRWKFAVLPLVAIVLVALHYSLWGEMLAGYPSPYLLPARVAWLLTAPPLHNQLPLKPVAIPLRPDVERPRFDKIVFVMDESVRGDYLSINNATIDTTPFLKSHSADLINFGIATAGSNCSFQSRWLFRRGVRPWQLPDRPSLAANQSDGIVTGPRTNLWQFARAAGFSTVYIDPFTPSFGLTHSGLTDNELAFIDRHVVLDGPRERRDVEAARAVATMLREPGRMFIHVDKFGAHFPYDEDTPSDFNQFARPDGTRFKYYRKTLDDLVGSYKNAIAWSVDGFFRELLPNIDLNGVLLIYTADHGQNLWDDGPTLWRHCDSNPPPTELWVPLFAFTGDEQFRADLSRSASRSANEATHFEIFPTLLLAMGYDANGVTETYGPNLLDIPKGRPRRFIVGDVNGRAYRVWLDVRETGSRLRDRVANGCLSCLWR